MISKSSSAMQNMSMNLFVNNVRKSSPSAMAELTGSRFVYHVRESSPTATAELTGSGVLPEDSAHVGDVLTLPYISIEEDENNRCLKKALAERCYVLLTKLPPDHPSVRALESHSKDEASEDVPTSWDSAQDLLHNSDVDSGSTLNTDFKEANYKHSLCNEQFNKLRSLREHVRSNWGVDRCEVVKPCSQDGRGEETSSQPSVKRRNGHYGCSLCGMWFASITFLQAHHKTIHLKIKRHVCVYCNEEFVYEKSYIQHVKKHAALECTDDWHLEVDAGDSGDVNDENNMTGRHFFCCGKIFKYEGFLRLHQKKKHIWNISEDEEGKHKFLCKECGEQYQSKDLVTAHYNEHHAEKFVCGICSKSYLLEKHLRRHNERKHRRRKRKAANQNRQAPTVEPEKNFTCVDCGQAFADKFALISHALEHGLGKQAGGGEERNDKTFQTEPLHPPRERTRSLSKISKGVAGGQQTVAITAGETKSTSNEIGDRSFCCEVCGDTFAWWTVYRAHIRTHVPAAAGEAYACGGCGARFEAWGKLRQHMQSEGHFENPRRVSESTAPSRAATDRVLRSRLVIGSKVESPAETSLSSSSASSSASFACCQCDAIFDRERDLRRHMRREGHGLDNSTAPGTNSVVSSSAALCSAETSSGTMVTSHPMTNVVVTSQLLTSSPVSTGLALRNKERREQNDETGSSSTVSSESLVDAMAWDTSSLSSDCSLRTGNEPRYADSPPHATSDHPASPSNVYFNSISQPDRLFKCSFCPASFDLHLFLESHIRIHNKKAYRCRVCGLRFDNHTSRTVHFLQNH